MVQGPLQVPPVRSPIADAKGLAPSEWYEFFRRLLAYLQQTGVDPAVIADILARLDALEASDLGPFLILGPLSVQVQGTPANGNVLVQLVGDVESPGRLYAYRVDDDGEQGWSLIKPDETPSSIGVYAIDENGDWAIDENNRFAQTDLLTQVEALPDAHYTNVQHYINTMTSPGIITGCDLSRLDADTVAVSAGRGMIRSADDDVSSLLFFDIPASTFELPADQDTRFYGVVYSGSTVAYETRLVDDWNKDTEIPLGSAVRFNGTMVVTPNKYRTGDPITNVIQRFYANFPAARDNSIGGLNLGETGTRNITVSAGKIWSRLSDFDSAAKDSSADPMLSVYFNGTGLTFTSGLTQWDNLQYNDMGTGALVTMNNNKYASLWFFVSIDGSQYGFAYGIAEYNTLGEAADEGIPPYLTQDFFNQSLLLGRLLFQKSAATAERIETAFQVPFSSTAINDHNNLGGLQGGTTGEYYHLTAAEHANMAAIPSVMSRLSLRF